MEIKQRCLNLFSEEAQRERAEIFARLEAAAKLKAAQESKGKKK